MCTHFRPTRRLPTQQLILPQSRQFRHRLPATERYFAILTPVLSPFAANEISDAERKQEQISIRSRIVTWRTTDSLIWTVFACTFSKETSTNGDLLSTVARTKITPPGFRSRKSPNRAYYNPSRKETIAARARRVILLYAILPRLHTASCASAICPNIVLNHLIFLRAM